MFCALVSPQCNKKAPMPKNRNLRARLTAVLWRDLGLKLPRFAQCDLMT
jgi:hypothetical protein